jgi:hypothetical protein
MLQERLSACAILSIERETAETSSVENLMQNWVEYTANK